MLLITIEKMVSRQLDIIMCNVGYFYIGDKCKNLIDKILRYGLVNGDLHLEKLVIKLAYQDLLINL